MHEERLSLPIINLCPTMRCNLKCRLCGVMVPQYEYRPHMSFADFSDMLAAVFEFVDSVGKLQITGGEPLLHPDLPEMIERCFAYSGQFDKLWLITNGTLPMRSSLFEVLKKHRAKVVVHLSDYGVRRDMADDLVKTLGDNGIECKYLKYYGDDQYAGGWVDQGDFEKHGRSGGELAEVFSRCSHVVRGGSWYVRGGQMHWCGRSIRGTELEKVPLRDDDYLSVSAGTREQRREGLQRLMRVESILACDYCNGDYGAIDAKKRHPAGEQVK